MAGGQGFGWRQVQRGRGAEGRFGAREGRPISASDWTLMLNPLRAPPLSGAWWDRPQGRGAALPATGGTGQGRAVRRRPPSPAGQVGGGLPGHAAPHVHCPHHRQGEAVTRGYLGVTWGARGMARQPFCERTGGVRHFISHPSPLTSPHFFPYPSHLTYSSPPGNRSCVTSTLARWSVSSCQV